MTNTEAGQPVYFGSAVWVGTTGCFFTTDNLALPACSGSPLLVVVHIRVELVCGHSSPEFVVWEFGRRHCHHMSIKRRYQDIFLFMVGISSAYDSCCHKYYAHNIGIPYPTFLGRGWEESWGLPMNLCPVRWAGWGICH